MEVDRKDKRLKKCTAGGYTEESVSLLERICLEVLDEMLTEAAARAGWAGVVPAAVS